MAQFLRFDPCAGPAAAGLAQRWPALNTPLGHGHRPSHRRPRTGTLGEPRALGVSRGRAHVAARQAEQLLGQHLDADAAKPDLDAVAADFSREEVAWMGEALELAREGGRQGEAPIGAVVVLEGRIIGRGTNRRELDDDPSGHAELVALREAGRRVARWRLDHALLVVTLEPCLMCAGASLQARVGEVLFGARDPKAGALESLYTVGADPRLPHRLRVRGGCREQESLDLLTGFFADLRAGKIPSRPRGEKQHRGFLRPRS